MVSISRFPFPVFRCCFSLLTFFFALPTFSQQRWERTYGGASGDYGHSVQQTSDGGYIVAGLTRSFGAGNYDVYLIKTNASGDTLWTRTYGGKNWDQGNSVQQTTDGGYIIVGYTSSFRDTLSDDVYLIKTDASGDTLWTKTYGGNFGDEGWSIQQTSDGGYIIAGITSSFGVNTDVWLIKTNASGNTLWTRTYGGTSWDLGEDVKQTTDGGYIIAGWTRSFGNSDQVYLVKTNASGDTIWTRTYGGTNQDWGNSVQQTLDGGYIVAGWTNSFGNTWQVYLIKTNALGDTLWTRTYGGAMEEYGYSVHQTTDRGYIVVGVTSSFGNNYQVYLIKTNASGDTLWTRTYGGAAYDEGRTVQQTSDGGYIIAGSTASFGPGSYDVYLIKTDANGNVGTERGQGFEGPRVQGLKITPNPFISFATLPGHEAERFSLYDIAGRRVGTYRGDRIGEGLTPGVRTGPRQTGLKRGCGS